MIGRRATAGLSLLCALLFCAFAVQSASAASSKNTTAFTCVENGGVKDYSDAHCDKFVGAEKGKFGHVAITTKTNVVITNAKTKGETTAESTNAVLKGELGGAKLEIICKTVSGEGSLTNEEPEAKVHRVKGTLLTLFKACEVVKPAKCTVKEPIEVNANVEGVDGLGAGKNEMGLESKPAEGKIFVTIKLEGAECALKASPLEVEGTAISTGGTANQTEKWAGVTSVFTTAMTKETLSIGKKPAEFSTALTTRMAPVEGKEQNPISGTTLT